jgi:hypothetical protein
LCRFGLPSPIRKPQEKVFVLGAKGRRLLREMGVSCSWYFRPHKLKFLSYGYVLHNLILTRTLIAAGVWAKHTQAFSLVDKRISYELAGKVITDGWLCLKSTPPRASTNIPSWSSWIAGWKTSMRFVAMFGDGSIRFSPASTGGIQD